MLTVKVQEIEGDVFAPSTAEERILWPQLRAKRFGGFKFRRQHRIGPYFADFCCIERRLIIELDGNQHAEQAKEGLDAARSAYLRKRGYQVIRFWNEQVNRRWMTYWKRFMKH